MKIFDGLDEFVAAAGSQLGPTDWLPVEQDRVDQFADGGGSRSVRVRDGDDELLFESDQEVAPIESSAFRSLASLALR